MPEQHPVNELMNDHRLIENVMAAMEDRLANCNDAFPADFVAQALAFFVEFADGHHHYKEEEALFPAMAEHGVPVEGGPIGMMLYEHSLGRELLAAIRDRLPQARNGDAAACAAIRQHAGDYIGLLRNHIWKEDNVLFRMALNVLDPGAVERLAARFHEGAGSAAVRQSVLHHVEFAGGLS